MAGGSTVKLFQFNQNYCQRVGICAKRSNPNPKSTKRINLIFITVSAQFALASLAFLVYDAKTMGEHCIAFYTFICITEALTAYSILIWKVDEMANFIANCEAFIEKSKCHLKIYNLFFFQNYNKIALQQEMPK